MSFAASDAVGFTAIENVKHDDGNSDGIGRNCTSADCTSKQRNPVSTGKLELKKRQILSK